MRKFYFSTFFMLLSCLIAQAQVPDFTGQRTFHWDAQSSVRTGRTINAQTQQQLSTVFKAYDIYTIDAQAISSYVHRSAENATFSLALEDHYQWEINLKATDLLSETYQATALRASGKKAMARPEKVTYQGTVVGEPDSEVRLMLDGDKISGFIMQNRQKVYIENVANVTKGNQQTSFLVYRAADVQEEGELLCLAVKEESQKQQIDQKNQRTAASCSEQTELKIATFATYDRYVSAGGESAVNNEILAILNNVQANYDDYNVQFKVVEQVVSTCSSCDPWSTPSSPSDLLTKFTNWGPGGFNQTHNEGICFFDGTGSGTVGVAWVGAVCTRNRYAVCDKLGSGETNRVLVAHEMGHNFSANHDASGSPYIMAPSVNVTSDWSGASVNAINSHIASRTCLECVEGDTPPVACAELDNLQVSNIETNTAVLSWTTASGARAYAVRIRRQYTATWTDLSTSDNQLAISGLQPNTTYQWQVLSSCSGEVSSWASGSNFTTLPEENNPPVTDNVLPWSEDFSLANGTTEDDGATGWTSNLQSSNGGFASVQHNQFAINAATCQWTTAKIDVSSVSAVSVQLELQGNYYYTMESSDEIKVEYRADNNSWQQVYRATDGFSKRRLSGNFTNLGSVSTIQFRVTGKNNITNETYYIDNVSVDFCNSCADVSTMAAATTAAERLTTEVEMIAYPNPFTDHLTFQYNDAGVDEVSIQIYNLEGKLIYKDDQMAANTPLSFGEGLKPGLYILQVKTANGTEQIKILKR